MNKNILALMPVFVFMIIMLIVSIYVRRASAKKASEGFVKDYFIGSRSLGGFVLAMTTVATYSSVSSFVGGPGQAWSIGFGWIYMSVVQVTALLLVLGILGKKMAMVSRKIDAVTIIDVIRHRYQSDVLANISAIIIVIFFAATMVAQFVGGAKLFEAVTGYSYLTGLIVFGLVVVIYTTVGGFRGVAITDAICAVVMLAGMVILLIGIIRQGGGYENIMENIAATKPEMLEPLSDGNMPVSLYISQWMLVGIFTLGLPQSAVRCLSYKDTKSLHHAIILGTVVVGAMNIGMNFIGDFPVVVRHIFHPFYSKCEPVFHSLRHMPLPDALKIGSLLPVSEVILVLFRPIIESLARLLPRAPGGNPHQSGLLDTFCVAEIWIHIQCNGPFQLKANRIVIFQKPYRSVPHSNCILNCPINVRRSGDPLLNQINRLAEQCLGKTIY